MKSYESTDMYPKVACRYEPSSSRYPLRPRRTLAKPVPGTPRLIIVRALALDPETETLASIYRKSGFSIRTPYCAAVHKEDTKYFTTAIRRLALACSARHVYKSHYCKAYERKFHVRSGHREEARISNPISHIERSTHGGWCNLSVCID